MSMNDTASFALLIGAMNALVSRASSELLHDRSSARNRANNSLTQSVTLQREAAIRITDGTENPSPPGESRSLIAGQHTRNSVSTQHE